MSENAHSSWSHLPSFSPFSLLFHLHLSYSHTFSSFSALVTSFLSSLFGVERRKIAKNAIIFRFCVCLDVFWYMCFFDEIEEIFVFYCKSHEMVGKRVPEGVLLPPQGRQRCHRYLCISPHPLPYFLTASIPINVSKRRNCRPILPWCGHLTLVLTALGLSIW